jgi:hypothetical protein
MSQDEPVPLPNEALYPLPSSSKILTCTICGKQDETVRAVIYPWLVSLLVVTFRRAFAGVWCQKHRRMRFFAASLMTSTLGWLGIPHGLLWTPGALLTLARGGVLPPQPNADHLQELGEARARSMDIEGAIQCLEASLKFVDNPSIRARIQSLRSMNGLTPPSTGCVGVALTMAILFVSAALTGTAVATVYRCINLLLSPLFANGVSILFAMLSWAPIIASAFIGGLVLFRLIEWALTRIRCRSRAAAVSMGLLTAVIAAYGILQGDMIVFYVIALLTGSFSSVAKALASGIVVALVGGIFFPSTLDLSYTADLIYLCLLIAAVIYFLAFAWRTASETAKWQSRLIT